MVTNGFYCAGSLTRMDYGDSEVFSAFRDISYSIDNFDPELQKR